MSIGGLLLLMIGGDARGALFIRHSLLIVDKYWLGGIIVVDALIEGLKSRQESPTERLIILVVCEESAKWILSLIINNFTANLSEASRAQD